MAKVKMVSFLSESEDVFFVKEGEGMTKGHILPGPALSPRVKGDFHLTRVFCFFLMATA